MRLPQILNNFKREYDKLDFYDRALYKFTVIIIVFIGGFIPIRWSQEEMNLVLVNVLSVSIIGIVNLLLLVGKQNIARTIFVLSVVTMIIVSTLIKGGAQISWLYPASAMIFFTMTPKKALLTTTTLVFIVGWVVLDDLSTSRWLQNILSAQCTIFIVYVFCQKVHTQLSFLDSRAMLDSLSGLSNRRAFDQHLSMVTKEHPNFSSSTYLILIDIDHFKQINDTHGHVVGDDIIKHLAEQIYKNLRNYDKAYRVGGEEFALIVRTDTISDSLVVAERLRQSVQNNTYKSIEDTIVQYTVSIGIAVFNPDTRVWYNSADRALYQAKREGRNKTIISDPQKNDTNNLASGVQLPL